MPPKTCAFLYCTVVITRRGHKLCYEHYQEEQAGEINLCPSCGVTYKPSEYPQCRACADYSKPTTKTCTFWNCNVQLEEEWQKLCYTHYKLAQQGKIELCPSCQRNYKNAGAPRCHECNTSQGNSNARTNQNELQVSESAMQTPCPICSAAMQPRMGRNGTFMGCTEYPDCNGTLNVDDNGDIVAQPELRHNPRTASREAQPVKYDGSGWDAPTAAPKPQLPDRFRKAVEQVEKNLVQHAAACRNNEASTTQFLVMPMVAGLGWNEYDPDQLQKEYKPAGRRRFGQDIAVDIALFQSGQTAVFIEVKRLDRTYDASFKKQLEMYAQHGADGTIAILTNGATWIVHNVTDGRLGPETRLDVKNDAHMEQLYATLAREGFASKGTITKSPAQTPKSPAQTPQISESERTEKLFQALTQYRHQFNLSHGLPPYVHGLPPHVLKEDTLNLPRIKVPAQGATTWNMPDGHEGIVQTIEGIIVEWTSPRAWWPDSIEKSGGSSPPACSSADSIRGFGVITAEEDEAPAFHDCNTCPHNQWDTGRNGRGKACKEKYMLYVVQNGAEGVFPSVVQIPPPPCRRSAGTWTDSTSTA